MNTKIKITKTTKQTSIKVGAVLFIVGWFNDETAMVTDKTFTMVLAANKNDFVVLQKGD